MSNTVAASLAMLALAGSTAAEPTSPLPAGQSAAASTEDATVETPPGDQWAPASMEIHRGLVLFKARVEGRDILALLDNGADVSMIDLALARKVGLALEAAAPTIKTSTGQMKAFTAPKIRFEIPKHVTFVGRVAATDLTGFSRAVGRPIEAILGGDYLNKMAVGLYPKNNALYIMRSGAMRPRGEAFSFTLNDRTEVDAAINGRPMKLSIDLGSNGAVALSSKAWSRAIPPSAQVRNEGTADASGVIKARKVARGTKFQLGSLTATDLSVTLEDKRVRPGDGFIGMAFLSRFATILDYPQKKLVLMPIH